MKKLTYMFALITATLSQAETNEGTLLECSTTSRVLISSKSGYDNDDIFVKYKQEQLNVIIGKDEISVENVALRNIEQKYKEIHGYSEYGNFSIKPTIYTASYYRETGDEARITSDSALNTYMLRRLNLWLDRLDGRFEYITTSYIQNLKLSKYDKLNAKQINSGFVHIKFDGKCNIFNKIRLF